MDSKLVLLKLISLIYCETILTNKAKRYDNLAIDLIDRLKLPKFLGDSDMGRSIIISLREFVLWLIEIEKADVDRTEVIQRLRIIAGDDRATCDYIKTMLMYDDLSEEEIEEKCQRLEREVKAFLMKIAVKDIIDKAYRNLTYDEKHINVRQLIHNTIADLEVYSGTWSEEEAGFVMNLMNMSDISSVKSVLEKARDGNSGTGRGLKTGYQALNRMLGDENEFRRGMMCVVGGTTHSYKSGLCHDIFRQFCIYNDPVLNDPTKKPLLIYASCENEAAQDILRMYVALVENETRQAVDISTIDIDEASLYVAKRLQERGWNVVMLRIDPTDFKVQDLFTLVLRYEEAGYEVVSIVWDYLALINKKDLAPGGFGGEDIRMLFQTVRTFMAARDILFITPHQLSQDSVMLKRAGSTNFLQELVGKNYWDGSKRLANEVDLEIYVDIQVKDNRSFLGVARGKHRKVKQTPKRDLMFYLPMVDESLSFGILDDINGNDSSVPSLLSINSGAIDFD